MEGSESEENGHWRSEKRVYYRECEKGDWVEGREKEERGKGCDKKRGYTVELRKDSRKERERKEREETTGRNKEGIGGRIL